jgi:hypothetical protein
MFGFRSCEHGTKDHDKVEVVPEDGPLAELESKSDIGERKLKMVDTKQRSLQKRLQIAILIFISIGLAITHGYNCYLSSTWGPVDEASLSAFRSFSKTFPDYIAALDKPWRPRIFANYL